LERDLRGTCDRGTVFLFHFSFLFSLQQKKCSLGVFDGIGLFDGEAVCKGVFKTFGGVIRENIFARGEEDFNLGILLGDEFDDEPWGEIGEEVGEFGEGEVVRDGKVVDECECEDHVGVTALAHSHALVVRPA